MNRRVFVAGLATGLAGCSSPTVIVGRETRTDRRTYDVESGTRLRIRNFDGSVTVEGHDGNDLKLDAEFEGSSSDSVAAASVTDARTDDELALRVEHDADERRTSATLTVRCPRDVRVAEVRTENGSVRVTDAAGDPELATRNGAVTARNVAGTVSLTTEQGAVTARGIGGVAEAATASGSVEVDVPSIPDDATIRSANGSIDAALATDLDADVFAATSNGSVELHDLELSAARTTETSVSGTLGEAGRELTFETSNGSIALRALSD